MFDQGVVGHSGQAISVSTKFLQIIINCDWNSASSKAKIIKYRHIQKSIDYSITIKYAGNTYFVTCNNHLGGMGNRNGK